jgi:hypothetical protein
MDKDRGIRERAQPATAVKASRPARDKKHLLTPPDKTTIRFLPLII